MRIFLTILTAVLISALVTKMFLTPQQSAASAKETAYERVMRTGELRCGYAIFAPYFTQDATSGALGGIWHDLTEAVAADLGLKVVWAEEIGLGDIPAALQAKRIDVYCGGLWPAGNRVRGINFLTPTAYEPILVYVRKDDHRFDQDIQKINKPEIKISTMDGEAGSAFAAEFFPAAQTLSLPQLSSYADMFNQVVTGKADVIFTAPAGAAFFMKNNPGLLRPLTQHPIAIFPVSLGVKYGEPDLRDMLNQAQANIINNGTMEKILQKGEVNRWDFWRVAKPYQIYE